MTSYYVRFDDSQANVFSNAANAMNGYASRLMPIDQWFSSRVSVLSNRLQNEAMVLRFAMDTYSAAERGAPLSSVQVPNFLDTSLPNRPSYGAVGELNNMALNVGAIGATSGAAFASASILNLGPPQFQFPALSDRAVEIISTGIEHTYNFLDGFMVGAECFSWTGYGAIIAGVVVGAAYVFFQTETGERVLRVVGNAITSAAKASWNWISSTAVNVGNAIGSAATAAWNWTAKTASTIGNAVTGAAVSAWNWVSGAAVNVGNAVVSGAQAVGNAVVSGAQAVGNAVVAGVQAVGNAVVSGAQAVGNAVVTGAQAVGNAIVSGATAVGNAIKKVFSKW